MVLWIIRKEIPSEEPSRSVWPVNTPVRDILKYIELSLAHVAWCMGSATPWVWALESTRVGNGSWFLGLDSFLCCLYFCIWCDWLLHALALTPLNDSLTGTCSLLPKLVLSGRFITATEMKQGRSSCTYEKLQCVGVLTTQSTSVSWSATGFYEYGFFDPSINTFN